MFRLGAPWNQTGRCPPSGREHPNARGYVSILRLSIPDSKGCPPPLRLGLPEGRRRSSICLGAPRQDQPRVPRCGIPTTVTPAFPPVLKDNPILKQLLPEHQQKVLNHLSPDLPLTVTANLIDDENYWRRCCMQRWPVCHVARHGGSWKRLFFERHLENLIKHFIPSTTDPAVILDLLPFCRNYVRRLRVDQFLPPVQLPLQPWNGELSDSGSEAEMEQPTGDHYQLRDLVAGLSHLEELDLVYGVKDCGMNFEWNLFLFTYQDCHSLAATIKACHTLKVPGGRAFLYVPFSPPLPALPPPPPSPSSPISFSFTDQVNAPCTKLDSGDAGSNKALLSQFSSHLLIQGTSALWALSLVLKIQQ